MKLLLKILETIGEVFLPTVCLLGTFFLAGFLFYFEQLIFGAIFLVAGILGFVLLKNSNFLRKDLDL